MTHHLAGLPTGGREACPVDHVVETSLKNLQKCLTGLARQAVSLFVVAAELLLQHAVGVAGLLLLAQLEQVLRVLRAATAMLAGRIGTMLESLVVADQIGPEASGLLGDGSGITGHCVFSPF